MVPTTADGRDLLGYDDGPGGRLVAGTYTEYAFVTRTHGGRDEVGTVFEHLGRDGRVWLKPVLPPPPALAVAAAACEDLIPLSLIPQMPAAAVAPTVPPPEGTVCVPFFFNRHKPSVQDEEAIRGLSGVVALGVEHEQTDTEIDQWVVYAYATHPSITGGTGSRRMTSALLDASDTDE
jgi:hypothetical protein